MAGSDAKNLSRAGSQNLHLHPLRGTIKTNPTVS